MPKSANDLPSSEESSVGAFDIILGRDLAEPGKVTAKAVPNNVASSDVGPSVKELTIQKYLVYYNDHGEEVPCTRLQSPDYQKEKGRTVLWTTTAGKAGLLDANSGKPIAPVQKLLDGGCAVVGIDMINQGELSGPDGTRKKARIIYEKTGAISECVTRHVPTIPFSCGVCMTF